MTQPKAAVPEVTRDMAYQRAWKYMGYRQFSKFLGSHEDFMMVRQYRTLNARVILAMQDHLAELEAELDELEAGLHHLPEGSEINNGTYRLESSTERHELIWKIHKRLKEYSMRSHQA